MTPQGSRINYEIHENLGTLSASKNGWTREVNLISWEGGPIKLDIRSWDPDHERMDRGKATFTKAEAVELMKILEARFGRADENKE